MQQRMWRRGPDGEIIREPPARPERTHDAASRGEAAPRRGRASLGLALRLGARDSYDYLGAVVLMSLLFAAAAVTAALGGQALGAFLLAGRVPPRLEMVLTGLGALAGMILVGGPLAAGLARFAANAAARREPEVFDLAWGYRAAARRSIALAGLQTVGVLLLAGNFLFYVSQRHPALVVLGAMFGYVLGFWLLACQYQWPLLAEQEIAPLAAIRKSALLTLDNFLFSLGLGLVVLALTGLLWVTMIGGVLLWAGVSAVLLTQGTRELLRKYGALPPDPTLDPIADETHELAGHGRHE